ncbi:ATP-utilizing chromatin assembly and remodelling N-terminal-domain-containing protein [Phycomyces nitens]|nr:ATP-utilizing chromatin assembly and remodelling N-terminal-domain-containing protein [Phycomyces nitens]
MPLLNNKRIAPIAPTSYDPKKKRKEVWYLRFTNEVFTSYESYINRLALYQQPIWQCEVTGRQNLTYEQALESESGDDNRAEFRFCITLRKHMLDRVQFQTLRLDSLVEDVYNHFKANFSVGEIVHWVLGEDIYLAKIIEKIPNGSTDTLSNQTPKTNTHRPQSDTSTESEDDGIPRQPNGRLRFPDAFLHPAESFEAIDEDETMIDDQSEPEHPIPSFQYKIQLVNQEEVPLENFFRLVDSNEIKRDQRSFCRPVIQRFIRECAHKDSYLGAPWLIKPNVAHHYKLDTSLPSHLQEAQDIAYAKIRKRRAAKTTDEKEAERRARKEDTLLQKAKLKEEKDRQREERRKQAAVKYPVEDLDLPIYRKDPNLNWALVDMSPTKTQLPQKIPYPSGGRPQRPTPHMESVLPTELVEQSLILWSFLNVFSDPLELSPFSVDDFERALIQTNSVKSTVMIECNACLLNVIIRERKEDIANDIASGEAVEDYLDALEEEEEDEEDKDDVDIDADDDKTIKDADSKGDSAKPTAFSRLKRHQVERGWRDPEQLKIGQGWDKKEIRQTNDRKGWESVLIGCLNEIATPDMIPQLDQILRHLVPRINSTATEREKQYPSLSVKHKLMVLKFLVDVVNESTLIKDYMEECQEQLTEFRRQKVEMNKEAKLLASRRLELDRRDQADKEEQESSDDDVDGESNSENSESGDDFDSNSDEEDSGESAESDTPSQGPRKRARRHLSRQEKLKQKQKKRAEMEALRKKQYEKQREATKARNQELRQKAEERRKLDDEEKTLHKKEEQLEKDMRKYMTLRIRPLGRDRFYNQYIYLDNVGTSNTYGTGRLYIQSPNFVDIQIMMERDIDTGLPEQPWGRGGGQWFILELMKAQGFGQESEWLEKQMDSFKNQDNDPSTLTSSWWRYYSEPEEIQQLMSWLNPKGSREYKLKNELLKQQAYIIESMQKRTQALLKLENGAKRNAKGKSSSGLYSWLSSSNKSTK